MIIVVKGRINGGEEIFIVTLLFLLLVLLVLTATIFFEKAGTRWRALEDGAFPDDG